MKKYTPAYLGKTADRLGSLRNEIAELKRKEQDLVQILTDSKEDTIEGKTFRVTVSRSLRTVINWQAIAKRVGFSNQLLSANTKRSTIIRVNTNAKIGDSKAA